MAHGDAASAVHPPAVPPSSPNMILLSILLSFVLVALALLIQSDSKLLQRVAARLWPPRIDIDAWQKTVPSPTKPQSSHPMRKSKSGGKNGGKRRSTTNTSSTSQRRPNTGTAAVPSPANPPTSSRKSTPGSAPSSPVSPKSSPSPSSSSSPIAQSKPRAKKPTATTASASAVTPCTPPTPVAPSAVTSQHHSSEPTTPQRPNASRSLSCSNILHSLLNPRAAAYEFRAQYSDLPPLDPASSSTDTPSSPDAASLLPSPEILDPVVQPAATAAIQTQTQPHDAFLVLDVEATCAPGSTFDYPNEIIEWPVVLMRWSDKDDVTGNASELVVVDEFRSFVRPTWRPQLTDFCTSLTGIQQTDIEQAPTFPQMLTSFEMWLQKHNLIPPPTALLTPPSSRCPSPAPSLGPLPESPEEEVEVEVEQQDYPTPVSDSGVAAPFSPAMSTSSLYSTSSPSFAFSPRASNRTSQSSFSGFKFGGEAEWDGYAPAATDGPRFAWATDGPFDLRDFLVKQCFISRIAIPEYFLGDVIDVRKVVGSYVAAGGDKQSLSSSSPSNLKPPPRPFVRGHGKRPSLNIPSQLQALALGGFSGQQHSGIDDARNICRILQALASRAIPLEANMYVNPNRRWYWMGTDGVVLAPSAALLTPP